jgi:hypothetical protein
MINLKLQLVLLISKTGNLFGKDIVVNLNEKNFDKDNQPRLKGNSIEYDKDKTVISKGDFYNL